MVHENLYFLLLSNMHGMLRYQHTSTGNWIDGQGDLHTLVDPVSSERIEADFLLLIFGLQAQAHKTA